MDSSAVDDENVIRSLSDRAGRRRRHAPPRLLGHVDGSEGVYRSPRIHPLASEIYVPRYAPRRHASGAVSPGQDH